MAYSVSSTDAVSHPVLAIVRVNDGRTVKFPKVKPAGGSDANDAAWQTRMQTEVAAAHNQTMNGSGQNATPYLANMA